MLKTSNAVTVLIIIKPGYFNFPRFMNVTIISTLVETQFVESQRDTGISLNR